MDSAWYRKLFSHARQPDLNGTRARADRGDADAQFALGLKYGNGEGELQDFPQAAQWYRRAADQNHLLAQFNLGIMYAKGQGVPLDDAEAVTWIRKAAEGGDAGAQFNLGVRYHRASLGGIQMDAIESRIEAYKWYRLAAAQGYKDSVASGERMTLGMSREEVVEGNHRVARCGAVKSADVPDR